MKSKFTFNDLVRFIYKETSAAETLAIAEAINEDEVLHDEYVTLMGGYRRLTKATFSPAQSVINNILSYSAQNTLEAQF